MEAARALADEIRRSGPDDPDVHEFVAENYELAGDFPQALRWYAMGLSRMERQAGADAADDWHWARLVIGRRRVRQALGYPPDDLDLTVDLPPDPSA